MQRTGAMGLAFAVARGEKTLAELRPFAQTQVKRIMAAYGGEQAVKELATHKSAHVKIGRRATHFRKASTQ